MSQLSAYRPTSCRIKPLRPGEQWAVQEAATSHLSIKTNEVKEFTCQTLATEGCMVPYRTHIEMESGNRKELDASIGRIRSLIERKGAKLRGPHTRPTKEIDVPLYKTHLGDRRFEHWRYHVYSRTLEVIGHEGVTREIASLELPSSINISIMVEDAEPVR